MKIVGDHILNDMVTNDFISHRQWVRFDVTVGTSKFPPRLPL